MRKILTASAAGFTILSGARLVFQLVVDGRIAPAIIAGVLSIVALMLAYTASSGSREQKVAAAFVVASLFVLCNDVFGAAGLGIAAILVAAGGVYFAYRYVTGTKPKPSKATVKSERKPAASGAQKVMGFVALLAIACGAIAAAIMSNGSMSEETTHAITADFDGRTLDVRLDLASIDQPLVGDGVNVATPPVLNDGKGLITGWGNFYDRVLALPQAGRDNTIANVNAWAATTKRVNPDKPELWFPTWSEIETNLRFVAGEFRVILKVNTSKTDQQAKDAIRAAYPNSPELQELPVVTINGSIVNTECGGGDCRDSATPAQQFIDTNGQFRIVLTKPILGKEGHWSTNFQAAEHGVGLATECGNGLLGVIKEITPAIVQTVKSATGGPSSTTTIKTTTNTTTGSTTTQVTTTTGSTTTTTTATTTSSTTTTGTTTSSTTTSTTTTTGTTTTMSPPVTTTTTSPPVTTTTETTKPKDTDTSSYTVKPSAPEASVTGSAAPPTVPTQPGGTTTTGAPITSATAPSAIPTEEPTQPTGTANPTDAPDTSAPDTTDVDPDGTQAAAAAQAQANADAQAQAQADAAAQAQANADAQRAADAQAAADQAAADAAAAQAQAQAQANADAQAQAQADAAAAQAAQAQAQAEAQAAQVPAPLPQAIVVEPAVPAAPVVPTQEPQAPAPSTQPQASAAPTTVADVTPAASSHSTENGGFIAGALVSLVLAVFTFGFVFHRRRNPGHTPAHKA